MSYSFLVYCCSVFTDPPVSASTIWSSSKNLLIPYIINLRNTLTLKVVFVSYFSIILLLAVIKAVNKRSFLFNLVTLIELDSLYDLIYFKWTVLDNFIDRVKSIWNLLLSVSSVFWINKIYGFLGIHVFLGLDQIKKSLGGILVKRIGLFVCFFLDILLLWKLSIFFSLNLLDNHALLLLHLLLYSNWNGLRNFLDF